MGYKAIDDSEPDQIDGFRYTNLDGDYECVHLYTGSVEFRSSGDECASVYVEDIPKLIKALQAAYDYKRENGFE